MWPTWLLHVVIKIKTSYALGHSVKSMDFQELFWVQYRKEWNQEVKALLGNYMNVNTLHPVIPRETGKGPSLLRDCEQVRDRGTDP